MEPLVYSFASWKDSFKWIPMIFDISMGLNGFPLCISMLNIRGKNSM
jgi:hypothetical protein